jgi:tRNA pseudouridine32 synthase/23S rRNA pseudouridine746 synthase
MNTLKSVCVIVTLKDYTEVKYKLRGGELLKDGMYDVIADHEYFLLIDKYPGVGFHRESDSKGLMEVLRSDLNYNVLYSVHRLDKMTSGLILFAKNRGVARELARLFYTRSVEKYYIAISDRRPRKKQGLIAGDMERTRRGMWKLSHGKTNPAVTQFFSRAYTDNFRLFVLKPHTGKTHQLRVALKSIGSPVLGDPLYHKTNSGSAVIDRGYLHSYALCFQLHGDTFRFVGTPNVGMYFTDESFRNALEEYKRPWKLSWPRISVR